MPIYTFHCPCCQHETTDLFSMKDSEGKNLVCPQCGHKGLKPVFKNSFSIINKNKSFVCPTGTCPLAQKGNDGK